MFIELKGLVLLSPAGLAPHEESVPVEELSFKLRMLDRMWNRNYTPQMFARLTSHWAPNYVKGVIQRRFGADRWSDAETSAISSYLYHISALPASGEYALNTLLMARMIRAGGSSNGMRPRIYAREPITAEHLAPLKGIHDSLSSVPVLVMYGDNDWISFPGVADYVNGLKDAGIDATYALIADAGHHLYMDNPDQCHREIDEWWAEKWHPKLERSAVEETKKKGRKKQQKKQDITSIEKKEEN